MANYTQKAILGTFENMLREMSFDKITVSALVARCEISSNTFYYHYRDIYDLLDKWLDVKLSKYKSFSLGQWRHTVKVMLHDIQDNPEIIRHVFESISRDRLERYIFSTLELKILRMVRERAEGMTLSEETKRMLAGAFCYSLLGFIFKFIWDDMKGDIDAYFDPILDFLESGITDYVCRKLNKSESANEPV